PHAPRAAAASFQSCQVRGVAVCFRDSRTARTHGGTHDPTRARLVWPPARERRRFSRVLEICLGSWMPSNVNPKPDSKIDPADRKLLLATAAVLIFLTAAVAFVSPPPSELGHAIPSIFSTSPDGARAAYLLLQQLGRNVQPWERPPTELPEDAENTVLIL